MAYIAIKYDDNSVRSIICEDRGKPRGLGATLLRTMTNRLKVERLIDRGNLYTIEDSSGRTKPSEKFPGPALVHQDMPTCMHDRIPKKGCVFLYMYDCETGAWSMTRSRMPGSYDGKHDWCHAWRPLNAETTAHNDPALFGLTFALPGD